MGQRGWLWEWEMTSLGRLLPGLQGIKLAFVTLLASVPRALKYKGFWQGIPGQHYCSRICYWKGYSRGNLSQARLLLATVCLHTGLTGSPPRKFGQTRPVGHCAISPSPTLPAHYWWRSRAQSPLLLQMCSKHPSHARCWDYSWG